LNNTNAKKPLNMDTPSKMGVESRMHTRLCNFGSARSINFPHWNSLRPPPDSYLFTVFLVFGGKQRGNERVEIHYKFMRYVEVEERTQRYRLANAKRKQVERPNYEGT